MPHDLKLSPFSPQKKQLKATLIFTKHSYMHTWKHRCKAVGLMTKTDLTTFVHRGQDPRSGPDLMTRQLQPSISQLHQPLCSTDNSWHSPTWMPRSGGKAVSARGGGCFDLVLWCTELFTISLLMLGEKKQAPLETL